jgi:hypothetical protein
MLVGVIACLKLIGNKTELKQFLKKYHLTLIEIDVIDTIGSKGNGSIAANCLALPGIIIGGSKFKTRGVNKILSVLDIEHIITPTTQFRRSGGGVHCLTNEIT